MVVIVVAERYRCNSMNMNSSNPMAIYVLQDLKVLWNAVNVWIRLRINVRSGFLTHIPHPRSEACSVDDNRSNYFRSLRWGKQSTFRLRSSAPASIWRVGSSRIRNSDWETSHRAIMTFCGFPPFKFFGICSGPAALLCSPRICLSEISSCFCRGMVLNTPFRV